MIIDEVVNNFMFSIEAPAYVFASELVAEMTEPIVLVVLSLVIAGFLYFKGEKRKALFFSSVMLATGVLIKVLKEIVGRARPFNLLINETSYSFPSGHATTAVVFFGLLVYLFAEEKDRFKAGTLGVLIALFIGFTRLYLRVHWFTDVLGGLILGGLILTVGIIFYRESGLHTPRVDSPIISAKVR